MVKRLLLGRVRGPVGVTVTAGGGGVADGGVGGGDALFRDVGEFLAVAEAVVGKGDAVEAGELSVTVMWPSAMVRVWVLGL